MGYGEAWVEDLGCGHEFAVATESLTCHLLARPTPGFKPTPMGSRPNPRPNPSNRDNSLDVFSQPKPKPHSLICPFAPLCHNLCENGVHVTTLTS
ncbi:hypothetical protein Hanom_Chr07g00610121 [Helianthus anomalus]